MNNNNIEKWLNELMLETKATLYASISKLLDKEDAEDVLQEAYLKVYEAKKSGLQHENYKAFLFKVARNSALSRLRHKKVINHSLKTVHDVNANRFSHITNEDKICKEQESELLYLAINDLPPICRQVFVLRKFKNKPHSEIAIMLNISKKTVENHITKAVKHCRDSILLHYKKKSMKVQIKKTGT
ncbi:MAG: RNA polymerase sigma-70 factor (family 1) [Psychroserpens sp.]|jgi:RNA polymerase sigma-70 factor (family 1)